LSYLVLARKYRPQVFDDIVGQSHVTQTLVNAIAASRVAHAYLFCGPRGVGKTTAARILAKALNCEQGPTAVPCNACARCLEITDGRSLDVLEIDGASNRGIDEIRELRDNTRYAPASGQFKVYIIDEVHMLTKEAFNALLKTLEEPPPHVIFVLATTDPFKVPPTILSRVQRFDFARIPGREIAAHLQTVLEREGIEASPEALAAVARRAQGGLRDALSLLDQIISAVEGAITREGVESILGLVGTEFCFELVDRLAEGDAPGAMRLVHDTHRGGADLEEVGKGLTAHLRDLFLIRMSGSLADMLDIPESEVSRYTAQAERFDPDVLSELLEQGARLAVDLRRHDNPRLALELALVDMVRISGRIPISELYERLAALEARLGGSAPASAPDRGTSRSSRPAPRGSAGTSKGAPGTAKASPPPAHPPGSALPPAGPAGAPASAAPAPAGGSGAGVPRKPAAEAWSACLEALKTKNIRLWGTLHFVEALAFGDHGELVLRPAADNPLQGEALADPKSRNLLGEAMEEAGLPTRTFRLEADTADAAAPPSGKAGLKAAGPDERSMGEVFRDEPMIQKVIDMFDGEVLP